MATNEIEIVVDVVGVSQAEKDLNKIEQSTADIGEGVKGVGESFKGVGDIVATQGGAMGESLGARAAGGDCGPAARRTGPGSGWMRDVPRCAAPVQSWFLLCAPRCEGTRRGTRALAGFQAPEPTKQG